MHRKLILIFSLVAGLTSVVNGASASSALFLLIPPSARANGLGGASITLVDEESSISNPGALGLFHLNHFFSFSAPNNTAWLPKLADDINLKAFSFSAGLPATLSPANTASQFKLAFAGAFSKVSLDFGRIPRTDAFGNIVGFDEPVDKVESFSFGIGAEYFLRLGVGLTYQDVTSMLINIGAGQQAGLEKAHANAGLIGVILEAPFSSILSAGRGSLARGERPPWDLTLSVARVTTIFSDVIIFPGALQVDRMAEVKRSGHSLYAALNGDHVSRLSLRLVYENDSDGADSSAGVTRRSGIEIGLYDIAYLRSGVIDDVRISRRKVKTYGFGLRLRGLLELVLSGAPASESFAGSFLARRLDVRLDYSRIKDAPDMALGNTSFFKLSVSL